MRIWPTTFLALLLLASTAAPPACAGARARRSVPFSAEPPVNPYLADSPWPLFHRGPASQASTPLPGPVDGNVRVDRVDFLADAGISRTFPNGFPIPQTSPWLLLSSRRYVDAPAARSLWAVSFTDLYKYAVDGDALRFVDSQQLRSDLASIHWNFMALADGRIVVPSPLGSNLVDEPCRTPGPALMVFEDGGALDSPIRCVRHLTPRREDLAACRGPDGQPVGPVVPSYSMSMTGITFSGAILVGFRLPSKRPGNPYDTYLAAVDYDVTRIIDCAFLSESGTTNAPAIEPIDGDRTAIFLATAGSMTKTIWDPGTQRLERQWERPLPLRIRTGTTPTLVGYGEDKLVVVVDAPCAVVNPFTGQIDCHPDPSPGRMLALRRDVANGELYDVELPAAIRTVENSPSARGNTLVVAAYGGYSPRPAVRGVAAVSWDAGADRLELLWFNDQVQMNGVTTISEGSGLVYSSGVTHDGVPHLYGLRLHPSDAGPGGEVVLDVPIAPADDVWSGFDQGNQNVVADERTLFWATREGFVRVRPTGASPVTGDLLLIRAEGETGRRDRRLLKVRSNDAALAIGAGIDPTRHGGSLRLRSTGQEGVEVTYLLPAAHWKALGKAGKGYRYADKKRVAGPITAVQVNAGKGFKARGRGADLPFALDASSSPVDVVLDVGGHRYCARFDGRASLTGGKARRLKVTKAPAPLACP